MIIVHSRSRVPVRFTDERWLDMMKRQPEMKNEKSKILKTIEAPEFSIEGDSGEFRAVRFFRKPPVIPKIYDCCL